MTDKTAQAKHRKDSAIEQVSTFHDLASLSLDSARTIGVDAHRAIVHVGPLPSPETLAGYQKLVPDAPERIFAMAEKE
jgi:uncharacterized membrane protein